MAIITITAANVQVGGTSAGGLGAGEAEVDEAVTEGQVLYTVAATGNKAVAGVSGTEAQAEADSVAVTQGTGAGKKIKIVKDGEILVDAGGGFTKGQYYWLGDSGAIEDVKPASTEYITGLGIATSTTELPLNFLITGEVI